MQAITRYIFNQLLAAALFITLGLTLAIWLSQSLRWIGYIVNQGLPASAFIYFVGERWWTLAENSMDGEPIGAR